MAKKKGAPRAVKTSKPKPVVPFVPQLSVNKTGQSEAFDKALEASVTLLGHYYHQALSKYVDSDGSIVKSMPKLGDGPDDGPAMSPIDSLALDLAKVQQAALFINNLQRIRSDAAIDVTKNPLNG